MKVTSHKTTKPERLECPECGKSSMIMHRRTLLVSMTYFCPEVGCGVKIQTLPPRDPPSQPTSPPTGGTSPSLLQAGYEAPLRKAA